MTQRTSTGIPETAKSNQRLAILLAMAMFVLVVDTSMMNVSISAVVQDLTQRSAGFSPQLHSKHWYRLHSS